MFIAETVTYLALGDIDISDNILVGGVTLFG
jgi:hypothetical protein